MDSLEYITEISLFYIANPYSILIRGEAKSMSSVKNVGCVADWRPESALPKAFWHTNITHQHGSQLEFWSS